MKIYKSSLRLIGEVVLLCVILSLVVVSVTWATHFRYGHLSWKARPDIGQNAAEFTLFNSFRRSGYPGSGTDGLPITGDIIRENIGSTRLFFGDGTSIGTLDYLVVAFDPAADWIYCKALADRSNISLPIIHTYSGPGQWTAEINSCCRISTLRNNPDGNYRVLTTVNFNTETCSPVSTLPPIVNVQSGGTRTFSVPAADPDKGDTLSWRLAKSTEASGFSTGHTQPPAFSINSTTGLVTWNTTGLATGLWTAQVVIEANQSNTVRSQVAVDFLLNLTSAPPPGTTDPKFVQTVPTCGQTFDLAAGKNLHFTIEATDEDAGDIVTLNAIGLPGGATMTPGLPISSNPVSSTFDWTPTPADVGPHVVVFTATDITSRQVQCSVIIDVKVDTDSDGLPDDWEINGYSYNGVMVDLPAMGANPNHKDIFVEIDFMGSSGLLGHDHRPDNDAINWIINSFANAGFPDVLIENPDGTHGITLHVNIDDEIPHDDELGTNTVTRRDPNTQRILEVMYDWTDFDDLKRQHFNGDRPELDGAWEALSLSHHYCIFAHNAPYAPCSDDPTRLCPSSGIARGIPSSDFIVSLGGWFVFGGGDRSDQAGTFMHELGHTLELDHGGGDGVNYKPNYLSVMNYAFQFDGLRINGGTGNFDYSRFNLPPLDENLLNENVGLNGGAAIVAYDTKWYCATGQEWTDREINGPINWNCDDTIGSPVATDINQSPGGSRSQLNSFNDWEHLNFKGGLIGAGVVLPLPTETLVEEIDIDTAKSLIPPPPVGLVARPGRGSVRLNWNPVGPQDEWSYRVWRSTGGGPFSFIGTTTSTVFSDTNLVDGKTYSYNVTAVNSLGTESGPSNIVSATPR